MEDERYIWSQNGLLLRRHDMKCSKCKMEMVFVKTDTNIDLGVKGMRYTEDHWKCTKCKLKGASFTSSAAPRKRLFR